jgi:HlyD family secretion protein
VTYDVVVSIDNSDLALAPGMTASTSIVIDRRSETIRVPDQALRYVPGGVTQVSTTAGSSRGDNIGGVHVWILREAVPVAVPVAVGLDDNTFTEVLSGDLKPGDQVIVSEQRGSSGGSVPLPRL